MLALGDIAQHLGVVFIAGPHAPRAFPFGQQHLQVVQHQQRPFVPQVVQQQPLPRFQAGWQLGQRLWGQHLQAVGQQRFAGGRIPQGAPQHHLEVRGDLLHDPCRQC